MGRAGGWSANVRHRTDGSAQTGDRDAWVSSTVARSMEKRQMNKRSGFFFFAAAMAAAMVVGGCGKAPGPTATLPAASAAVGNVSDIDVTEHVKTALRQNESLKGFDITVVTLKGDVRLTGVLDSQAQIDEAIKIARASDGAHTIHDELTIKK
jgi:hyperosmotically inducible periplasmic protein